MDPDAPAAQRPYEVILSPLAVQDLAEIVTFIAADNPTVAERFGRALIQKTRLLVTFPELGRIVPEFAEAPERARELIHRAYRIIYRVDHARRRVEVSRFWHASRGTPEL
ncbi:MAG: type II toxin-antitoxin system RelE/ParE family toxin [Verrucomicrobia bacterium]|nr:type II toxin-antitoxin system RelE/ParE family toxin [Verrucomicrobiota bacterium]